MGVKIQTIKDIRFYLAKELKSLYKESEIRVLADILIRKVTGIKKLYQLYDNAYPVKESEAEELFKITTELKSYKPIQYILGETSFYNCTIRVNNSTLIPRPETEELVDLIIRENKDYKGNIIDFGTGSGCIAVALAANLPYSKLTGVEISEEALCVARENAGLNNVNISYIKGDIFNFKPETVDKAGIIVSNPPYVRNSEKILMNKNVVDFEPQLALFVTDTEPLIYYDAILRLADYLLVPGGRLYFEMNEKMGRPLSRMFESFNYSGIEIISDINDKERIIKGVKYV
jgi:release factor glutamine methyltransferase